MPYSWMGCRLLVGPWRQGQFGQHVMLFQSVSGDGVLRVGVGLAATRHLGPPPATREFAATTRAARGAAPTSMQAMSRRGPDPTWVRLYQT